MLLFLKTDILFNIYWFDKEYEIPFFDLFCSRAIGWFLNFLFLCEVEKGEEITPKVLLNQLECEAKLKPIMAQD